MFFGQIILCPCYTADLRTRFLADAGADEVMYQEFTKDFASMEAEKFPEFLKNAFLP